jgi:hypothetical protein
MSRWLLALGDRLNPVLVKEVRQALRGRLFRFGYGLTLSAALTISLFILMSNTTEGGDERLGPLLATAIFGCLLAACFAFVPFSAYMSMGGEWEENTYDLLVLSNLTPRRIVYGKLASAVVQSLVCFSAFTPFFVFAFLLRGINLPVLLLLLAAALLLSPCVSLIALGFSTIGGNRFQRVSLMVLLLVGLVFLTVGGTSLSSAALHGLLLFRMSWKDMLLLIGSIVSVGLLIGIYYGEVACSRLCHPEENGSTGVRVALVVSLVGLLAWSATFFRLANDPSPLSGIGTAALVGLLWPCAGLACEAERLGRRVERHVPKNGLLALLAAPFLPGGGRGMLFWLFMNLFLAAGLATIHGVWGSDPWSAKSLDLWWRSGITSVAFTSIYCTVYLGVPSVLFSGASNDPKTRRLARASVLLFILLSILVPSLLFFAFNPRGTNAFDHPLDPFWVVPKAWDGRGDLAVELYLFGPLALLLVFLMNWRRVAAGINEVVAASRNRRIRDLAHAIKAKRTPTESAADAPPPS